uniref:NET domain-containing protein n=1 Tax=viral metagenome TaxID=1070528 RepID=A0A6C0E4C6_9ZZZZ
METIVNERTNKLIMIRDLIHEMNKYNQIEVLRILKKYENITLNENRYGIHVNLTDLSDEQINELTLYINYVSVQETTLNYGEQQKNTFKNEMFSIEPI